MFFQHYVPEKKKKPAKFQRWQIGEEEDTNVG